MMAAAKDKIPCTVGVLTRNSGATLRKALEGVKDFAEIIICDGGSTDDTLAIAREFGARIMAQDKQFLNSEGRIINFGGAMNQMVKVASQPWYFWLCSDEYIERELIEEIREATKGAPAAYWMPRKFVVGGEVIECAGSYPNQQIRLFHRAIATQFNKPVHERIELLPGAPVKWLRNPMFVPLATDVGPLYRKSRRYIAIECARKRDFTFRNWVRLAFREGLITGLVIIRILKAQFVCRGKKMPLILEWTRIHYQLVLIIELFRHIRRI